MYIYLHTYFSYLQTGLLLEQQEVEATLLSVFLAALLSTGRLVTGLVPAKAEGVVDGSLGLLLRLLCLPLLLLLLFLLFLSLFFPLFLFCLFLQPLLALCVFRPGSFELDQNLLQECVKLCLIFKSSTYCFNRLQSVVYYFNLSITVSILDYLLLQSFLFWFNLLYAVSMFHILFQS